MSSTFVPIIFRSLTASSHLHHTDCITICSKHKPKATAYRHVCKLFLSHNPVSNRQRQGFERVVGGSISYHLLPALVSTLNLLLSAVSKQGPKHSFSVSASLLSTLWLYSSDHHSVQKQTILFVSSWLLHLQLWVQYIILTLPHFRRGAPLWALWAWQ